MSNRCRSRLLLFAVMGLASCGGTRGMYLWDGYERSVGKITSEGGQADVDAEIDHMVTLVERSKQRGVPTAPGVHAHLGYLYALKSDMDNALAAFLSEKELYPESAVFIDGLVTRMQGSKGGGND